MKRNETRENSVVDDSRLSGGGRCVRLVNGPVVLKASDAAEGVRRFVVVAGTVIFGGREIVPACDRGAVWPRSAPLAHLRGAFGEFATRS